MTAWKRLAFLCWECLDDTSYKPDESVVTFHQALIMNIFLILLLLFGIPLLLLLGQNHLEYK